MCGGSGGPVGEVNRAEEEVGMNSPGTWCLHAMFKELPCSPQNHSSFAQAQ